MTRTLLLILVAVAIMLGSFIWFVATWDPAERPTISTYPDTKMQTAYSTWQHKLSIVATGPSNQEATGWPLSQTTPPLQEVT